MQYYCTCGAKFPSKGSLIQHCALLTQGWPKVSIWTNKEHKPAYTEEQFRQLPKQEK